MPCETSHGDHSHGRHGEGGEGGHTEEQRHQDEPSQDPPHDPPQGSPSQATPYRAHPGSEKKPEESADHRTVEEMVEPADGDALRANYHGHHRHHRHSRAIRRRRRHHLHHDPEQKASENSGHDSDYDPAHPLNLPTQSNWKKARPPRAASRRACSMHSRASRFSSS